MPPRKKANNKVNEEVENKIKSFVNTANEKDCESSDEEYNIYVKSARNSSPSGARAKTAVIPPSETKSKISKPRPRTKIVPVDGTSREPIDPNEKLYKMFDEYKNELNELRNIVKPQLSGPIPVPATVIDVRRATMQLKFG